MKKFEYRISSMRASDASTLETLNGFGSHGWELVSTIFVATPTVPASLGYVNFFFKRENPNV